MTDTDPLVPALAGLVVDVVWFLDSCEDDEVDPDSAVKMMESVGWVLGRLPQDQRDRFLTVLADLAEAETEPGRREFLEAFPSPAAWLRLSQAEPNPDQAQVPGCRLTTGAPRWRRLACSASPARAPAGPALRGAHAGQVGQGVVGPCWWLPAWDAAAAKRQQRPTPPGRPPTVVLHQDL